MEQKQLSATAEWIEKFAARGYRLTSCRQAIFGVLLQTPAYLSIEDIYLNVRRRHPHIGLSTVYRTIEALTGMGLAYKCDFGDGQARYALSGGDNGIHCHQSLVCSRCNRIVDCTDRSVQELDRRQITADGLARKYDFKITHQVDKFYGLCGICNKKNQIPEGL